MRLEHHNFSFTRVVVIHHDNVRAWWWMCTPCLKLTVTVNGCTYTERKLPREVNGSGEARTELFLAQRSLDNPLQLHTCVKNVVNPCTERILLVLCDCFLTVSFQLSIQPHTRQFCETFRVNSIILEMNGVAIKHDAVADVRTGEGSYLASHLYCHYDKSRDTAQQEPLPIQYYAGNMPRSTIISGGSNQ